MSVISIARPKQLYQRARGGFPTEGMETQAKGISCDVTCWWVTAVGTKADLASAGADGTHVSCPLGTNPCGHERGTRTTG